MYIVKCVFYILMDPEIDTNEHTTIYVSSYCYICVLTGKCVIYQSFAAY